MCPLHSSIWSPIITVPTTCRVHFPPLGSPRVLSHYNICSESITSLSKSSPSMDEAFLYFFSISQSRKLSGKIIFSTHTKSGNVFLDFVPHSSLSLDSYKCIKHFLPSLSPQELYSDKIPLK